jgi:hypothetical protein
MHLRTIKPIVGKKLPVFARPFYYAFIYKYETPFEQRLLLLFPFLYRTKFVNYEASISGQSTDELLTLLDGCLTLEYYRMWKRSIWQYNTYGKLFT